MLWQQYLQEADVIVQMGFMRLHHPHSFAQRVTVFVLLAQVLLTLTEHLVIHRTYLTVPPE